MRNSLCCAVFAVAMLFASTASAAPIFVQAPSPGNGFPSDAKGDVLVADDFSIAVGDIARSVTWLGMYAFSNTPPAADDFEIRFYADAAGTPGALLQTFAVGTAVNRTSTGVTVGASTVHSYAADLGAGFGIAAATPYWLVIVNDTTGDPDDAWYWGVETPGNARISIGGAPFAATAGTTGATSFTLDNANLSAVPEPASLSLVGFGMGIATMVMRRRMRRRHASS